MVATEKVDRDAGINNFGELSKQTGIALWDNSSILEPKIEKVAHEKNFFGIGFYLIQPADKTLLTYKAAFPVGDAKMKIGGEVYFFLFLQYHNDMDKTRDKPIFTSSVIIADTTPILRINLSSDIERT